MKDDHPNNNIVAEKVFKTLIPRNENNLEIKEVTIREVYDTITKAKTTKACGNCEMNMFILKQIPNFAAICITSQTVS